MHGRIGVGEVDKCTDQCYSEEQPEKVNLGSLKRIAELAMACQLCGQEHLLRLILWYH